MPDSSKWTTWTWLSYPLVYVVPLAFWMGLTFAGAVNMGADTPLAAKIAVRTLWAPFQFRVGWDRVGGICTFLLMWAYVLHRRRWTLYASAIATTAWGFSGFMLVTASIGR